MRCPDDDEEMLRDTRTSERMKEEGAQNRTVECQSEPHMTQVTGTLPKYLPVLRGLSWNLEPGSLAGNTYLTYDFHSSTFGHRHFNPFGMSALVQLVVARAVVVQRSSIMSSSAMPAFPCQLHDCHLPPNQAMARGIASVWRCWHMVSIRSNRGRDNRLIITEVRRYSPLLNGLPGASGKPDTKCNLSLHRPISLMSTVAAPTFSSEQSDVTKKEHDLV